MFEELRDQLSFAFSWKWPIAQGKIIETSVNRVGQDQELLQLEIVYEFSVGDDGPYTGVSSWTPDYLVNQPKHVHESRRRLRVGMPIQVRFRKDDPSVNRLDGGIARLVKQL